MTNREKIILGLTAAAAVGGALYYAFTSVDANPGALAAEQSDYTALITRVQVSLTQGELKDREEHVLAAATTQWLRSPLRSRPLVSLDDGATAAIPLPEYTGFINTGPRPIAIIDGRDYWPGEAIQGGEFRVAQIYPDRVELLRRGARDPVRVLLEKLHVPETSR